MFCIGFDIGGTKIEATLFAIQSDKAAAATKTFELEMSKQKIVVSSLASQRTATDRHLGYPHILKSMAQLVRDVCQTASVDVTKLGCIGLALPGSVHPQTQMMINGNTMAFIGKPVAHDLAAALSTHVAVVCSNDANCFALAEAMCGAGPMHARKTGVPIENQTAVGIILGTGTGGGVVINAKMLEGRRGGAAEFGHSILFAEGGHPCYCGRSGCAEQYLSGPGLEAAFASRRYSQVKGFPTAAEIFEMAVNLDPVAIAVVEQYRRHLGLFLGQLTTILDPDYFVLGGGVSRQEHLYMGLSQLVAAHTFLPEPLIPIYKHEVGDSAGALGAALHAWSQAIPKSS